MTDTRSEHPTVKNEIDLTEDDPKTTSLAGGSPQPRGIPTRPTNACNSALTAHHPDNNHDARKTTATATATVPTTPCSENLSTTTTALVPASDPPSRVSNQAGTSSPHMRNHAAPSAPAPAPARSPTVGVSSDTKAVEMSMAGTFSSSTSSVEKPNTAAISDPGNDRVTIDKTVPKQPLVAIDKTLPIQPFVASVATTATSQLSNRAAASVSGAKPIPSASTSQQPVPVSRVAKAATAGTLVPKAASTVSYPSALSNRFVVGSGTANTTGAVNTRTAAAQVTGASQEPSGMAPDPTRKDAEAMPPPNPIVVAVRSAPAAVRGQSTLAQPVHQTSSPVTLVAPSRSTTLPAAVAGYGASSAASAVDVTRAASAEEALACARAPLVDRYGPFIVGTDTCLQDARRRLETAMNQSLTLRKAFTERVYGKYRVCLRNPAPVAEVVAGIRNDPVGFHHKLKEEIDAIKDEKEVEKKEAAQLNSEIASNNDPASVMSSIDSADQLMFLTAGLNLVILPEEDMPASALEGYTDRGPVNPVTGQRVKGISQAAATAGEVILDRTRKAAAMRVERQRQRQLQMLSQDVADVCKLTTYSRLNVLSKTGSPSVPTDTPTRATLTAPTSAAPQKSSKKPGASGPTQLTLKPPTSSVPTTKSGRSRAPTSLTTSALLSMSATAEEVKTDGKYSAATAALIARGVGTLGSNKSSQQRLRHPHPESLGGRRRASGHPSKKDASRPSEQLHADSAKILPPVPTVKERLSQKPLPVLAAGEATSGPRQVVEGVLESFLDDDPTEARDAARIAVFRELRKPNIDAESKVASGSPDSQAGVEKTALSTPIDPVLALSVLHAVGLVGHSNTTQSSFSLPSASKDGGAFWSKKLTSLREKVVHADKRLTKVLFSDADWSDQRRLRKRTIPELGSSEPSKRSRGSDAAEAVPVESIRGGGEILLDNDDPNAPEERVVSGKAASESSKPRPAPSPARPKAPGEQVVERQIVSSRTRGGNSSSHNRPLDQQGQPPQMNPDPSHLTFFNPCLPSAGPPVGSRLPGYQPTQERYPDSSALNALHLANQLRDMHHPGATDLAEYLGGLQQRGYDMLIPGAGHSAMSTTPIGLARHGAGIVGYSVPDRAAAARAMLVREQQQAAALLGSPAAHGYPPPQAAFAHVGAHPAAVSALLGPQSPAALLGHGHGGHSHNPMPGAQVTGPVHSIPSPPKWQHKAQRVETEPAKRDKPPPLSSEKVKSARDSDQPELVTKKPPITSLIPDKKECVTAQSCSATRSVPAVPMSNPVVLTDHEGEKRSSREVPVPAAKGIAPAPESKDDGKERVLLKKNSPAPVHVPAPTPAPVLDPAPAPAPAQVPASVPTVEAPARCEPVVLTKASPTQAGGMKFFPPSRPTSITDFEANLVRGGKLPELAGKLDSRKIPAVLEYLLSVSAAIPIPKALVVGPLKDRLSMPGLKNVAHGNLPQIPRDVVVAIILIWLWANNERNFQEAFKRSGRLDVDSECKWLIQAAVDISVRELSASVARGEGPFAELSLARKVNPLFRSTAQAGDADPSVGSRKMEFHTALVVCRALMEQFRIDQSVDSVVPQFQVLADYLDEARLGALRVKSQERVLLAAFMARSLNISESFSNAYVSAMVRAGEALGHGNLFELVQNEEISVSSMVPFDVFTDNGGAWEDPCKTVGCYTAGLTGEGLLRRAHARAMIQKSLRKLQDRHNLRGGTSCAGPFMDPDGSNASHAGSASDGGGKGQEKSSGRPSLKRRLHAISEPPVPPGTGSAAAKSWSLYEPRHCSEALDWAADHLENTPYGRHRTGERPRTISLSISSRSGEPRSTKRAKRSSSSFPTMSGAAEKTEPGGRLLQSSREIDWAEVAGVFQSVSLPKKPPSSRSSASHHHDSVPTKPGSTIFAPFCREVVGEVASDDDESSTEEDTRDESVLSSHLVVLDEMKSKLSALMEARKKHQERRRNKQNK